MFGYVMTNRETLSPEENARFRAYYCGLCRALGARYGSTGRLALSFDMTFLAMLLSSLYEPESREGKERCVVHPRSKHDYIENVFLDYAADMTIALAYHKALDDWKDDRNLTARTRAKVYHQSYRRVKALYPRQVQAIAQGIDKLSQLEKENCASIDPPANAFGDILGEVFVYRKDLWSNTLRQTGSALGRFIYLMDAYEDLEEDIKKKRYNPLIPLASQENFEKRVFGYLTLLLGEGTVAFEQLPLVENLPILRNILYSGVWTKYQMIQRKRRGKDQGDGQHEAREEAGND